MLLLAMTRAREAARQHPSSFESWRALGMSAEHLAIQAEAASSPPEDATADWDPVTMVELCQVRHCLSRALELAPNDFVTLGYLLRVTAMQGDHCGINCVAGPAERTALEFFPYLAARFSRANG